MKERYSYKRGEDEEQNVSICWMILRKKRYWNVKEEALDRTQGRTDCCRVYGRIIRQNTLGMNEASE